MIVALANAKGGVGKTSITVNIACHAVAHGNDAVIVDLDASMAATKWGERRGIGVPPETIDAETSTIDETIAALRKHAPAGWIFMDLPGRVGAVIGAALRLADVVLIPTRPHPVDLEGTREIISLMRRQNKNFHFIMSIAPPHDATTLKTMEELRTAGLKVCPVIIHRRQEIPDAVARGKGVNEYRPKGKATAEFDWLFFWLSELGGKK